jgi:hypothetical protein
MSARAGGTTAAAAGRAVVNAVPVAESTAVAPAARSSPRRVMGSDGTRPSRQCER